MKILVADDHALFRDGLISLLEAAGFEVIGQAVDGLEAVSETLRVRPELVLLDISMPVMNGLSALREIKARMPEVQVVMLTVSEEDADLFAAVKSGASGYLLKDLSAREFLDLLEGLPQGDAAITRKTTSHLMRGFADSSRNGQDPVESLTEREVELLQLVSEGLANKALAGKLSISENTVKYHIKKILRKLHARNRTEAVAFALALGMIKMGHRG